MNKAVVFGIVSLFIVSYPVQVYPQTADSVITLDAISVEAYQISTRVRTIPGSISVLTSADLNVTDGNNLGDALNAIPGVSMQSGTYTTNRIVIRGMGSRTPYNTNRIRTYLNDIPLTTSDGLSSPEEIDGMNLGRMEIIKGPSSALFGSGLGGSINLFTPSALSDNVNLQIQYGSFNTWKANASAGFQNKNTTFLSGIGHLHSDGYRENSRYERSSILLTAGTKHQRFSTDYILLLTGVYGGIPSSIGKTLFEQDPQAAASNWKAIRGYKKFIRGVAGFTLTNQLSDKITNKFIMFARGNDSYEKRPFNNLDDLSLGLGIRNKLTIHGNTTDWVLGTEWILEEYAWKLDTNQVVINHNRENRGQVNVFAIAYYRPSDKLNISFAGALNYIKYRLTDLYNTNGNESGTRKFPLIFSPRIGINYSPATTIAFYASAGHGFSLPSPEETLLPAGEINPDIKHEQGWQFEAGSRSNLFHGVVGFDITGYWIELNNLLVTKRLTEDIFTGINAGKSRHQGIEVLTRFNAFSHRDFPGKLAAEFTYTQTWNRFIKFSDNENNFDGNLLPGIPVKAFYLKMDWDPVEMLSFMADMRYTGSQYLDDGNTMKYESYLVSNVKLSVNFRMKKTATIALYGGINNIADAAYASMLIVNAAGFNNSEPRYYYPGLARNGYAGIRCAF